MTHVRYLIVGAGISGLSFANFIDCDDCLIIEREAEPGGYCRTVVRDGFTWDYSGHFFHFRNPEIERYITRRMAPESVVRVKKRAVIRYKDREVDFPFQKNIHQLPAEEFIDCLYDLFFRDPIEPTDFKAMLYGKFGKAISEKFLIPYNEKVYACDLQRLDVDAMGRFFPHADLSDIIRNLRYPDDTSYNETFSYPVNGAMQYIRALLEGVRGTVQLNEVLSSIDPRARTAVTNRRTIRYETLVSSIPFPALLARCGIPAPPLSWNKVLVFNLGFDRKGPEAVHWIYYPEPQYPFYRVGFYDNVVPQPRMSLYVEIGLPAEAEHDLAQELRRVLRGLREAGVVRDHRLVSWHSVLLDPAYVHIRSDSNQAFARQAARWQEEGIYSIGRYGGWKYCSIEDNVLEARALAERLRQGAR